MSEFEFRSAREADAAVILSFVKQIAEAEGHPDEVKSTVEGIGRAVFGSDSMVEAILAYHGSEPVGCAVFFPKYFSYTGNYDLYIEDLAIIPGMRGKGLGRKLMAHIAQLAIERGATKLEWLVNKDNASAIQFYQRLGATIQNQVSLMRIEAQQLVELAEGR